MSNTSDDNNTNDSLAGSSSSSPSNPVKSSMLRPSSLLSSAPKSFLRPASFRVDSAAADDNNTDAGPALDAVAADPPKSQAGADGATVAGDGDSAAAQSTQPLAATKAPTGNDGAGSTGPSSSGPAAINPFLNALHSSADDDADADSAAAVIAGCSKAAPASAGETSAKNGIGDSSSSKLPTNGLGKNAANLFKTANPTISTSSSGPSNFVFGQNVHERVTIESINSECTPDTSSPLSGSQLFAIAASSSATAAAGSSTSSDGSATPATPAAAATTSESLSEVARQYEESRAQKRKYEEVETFTGEEDETNVIDVNCKLFAFVASNWEERGPGNLRCNDNKDANKSPRIVFRTSGNLRVLLNTTIWPGMVVERPSQKSLRFSAIDTDGQIRIYLAMARPDDISILVSQLNKRISTEKLRPTAKVSKPNERGSVSSSLSSSTSSATTSPPSAPAASPVYLDPAVVDIKATDDIENGAEKPSIGTKGASAPDSTTAADESNAGNGQSQTEE